MREFADYASYPVGANATRHFPAQTDGQWTVLESELQTGPYTHLFTYPSVAFSLGMILQGLPRTMLWLGTSRLT